MQMNRAETVKSRPALTPAKDEKNITVWDFRKTTIKGSGYGPVTWEEWCAKEMARMSNLGRSVEIVTNEKGQIAIARKN